MSYSLIQPPVELRFRDLSRAELNSYGQWFFAQMPLRLYELVQAVNQTPEFEAWTPDFTPESLISLGDWFARQIETRQRSEHEAATILNRCQYVIQISGAELTERSFSLAMDMGMYFASVFVKQYKSLRWSQPLDDKKFADYGQPVLVGFGQVPLNPIRILVSLAYGFATGKQKGSRLRELYNYWAKQVQPLALNR